jgi:hypothetical protein
VDYWLAEGFLLDDCEMGYQIIRDLISSCLLQTSGSVSSKVKMHHVIRHLGLWLVNKTDQSFLAEAGMAMDSAPSAAEWKEATGISIMSNVIEELSFSPECRSLITRDGSGSGLERISADFGYVGCGFGSDFRLRVRGFGYPQHCGFGADSTFRPRISVAAPKN